MRDRAWFVRLYGEIILELKLGAYRPYRRTNHALFHLYHNIQYRPCILRAKARGLSLRTGAQTMLYLTCTMISNVELAYYEVSRAKD